jgi:hypothetical protein
VNPAFFRGVTTFIVIYHYLSKVSKLLGYDATSLGEQFLRPPKDRVAFIFIVSQSKINLDLGCLSLQKWYCDPSKRRKLLAQYHSTIPKTTSIISTMAVVT